MRLHRSRRAGARSRKPLRAAARRLRSAAVCSARPDGPVRARRTEGPACAAPQLASAVALARLRTLGQAAPRPGWPVRARRAVGACGRACARGFAVAPGGLAVGARGVARGACEAPRALNGPPERTPSVAPGHRPTAHAQARQPDPTRLARVTGLIGRGGGCLSAGAAKRRAGASSAGAPTRLAAPRAERKAGRAEHPAPGGRSPGAERAPGMIRGWRRSFAERPVGIAEAVRGAGRDRRRATGVEPRAQAGPKKAPPERARGVRGVPRPAPSGAGRGPPV